MVRWEPNAQGRLESAAMELYLDRGFDQTTVAEIAARAGLTERTFFRYYADKREVLFGGAVILHDLLVHEIETAPPELGPLDAVATALAAAGGMMQPNAAQSRQRQSVIDANPVLQERELIKLASLASAIAVTLRARGTPDPAAGLAAETGIAVFKVAFERWVNQAPGRGARSLPRLIEETMEQLRGVTAAHLQ